MAFGSTPVGVGPGKPTTDSGGKREELTTAAIERVSDYGSTRTQLNVLPDGGYTSEEGDPAFDDALTVVGAASASTLNASTAAACVADRKCILKC